MNENICSDIWYLQLPHADKIVLVKMAHLGDENGGNICQSVATVAGFCGASERLVQKVLSKYTKEGLLIKTREFDPATKRPNEYRFDLDVVYKWPTIDLPIPFYDYP